LVIILVAFSQGITGLSDLAINYLYKDDLKLQPNQVSRINSLAYLPWIIKPIYGFISDSFPIFGYRRKPYLFLFGINACLCWILMSIWVDSTWKAVTIVFITQTSIAFCNVIGEALVVETSQKQKETDAEAGAKNVSMYFLIKSCGSLLTAFSSGALLEYMDKRKIFLITACFPLMIVFSAILLIENKVKHNDKNSTKNNQSLQHASIQHDALSEQQQENNLKDQVDLFVSFIKLEQIYKPVIFIFLYTLTPSYSDPLFYFYTNNLKFTPTVMGRLKLIYGIASVLGIWSYNKYLKNVQFKKIMWVTTMLSMFFNLLTILLVTRYNLKLGIPDFIFCMAADALTTALGELNTMPLLVLACNICPKNIEGTLYAFFMSVSNLGTLFSNQIGSGMTQALGITSTNFANLPLLIFFANIVLLLPMPALYLVNDNAYIKKQCLQPDQEKPLFDFRVDEEANKLINSNNFKKLTCPSRKDSFKSFNNTFESNFFEEIKSELPPRKN
jgi:folate/biopterin transporter